MYKSNSSSLHICPRAWAFNQSGGQDSIYARPSIVARKKITVLLPRGGWGWGHACSHRTGKRVNYCSMLAGGQVLKEDLQPYRRKRNPQNFHSHIQQRLHDSKFHPFVDILGNTRYTPLLTFWLQKKLSSISDN